VTDYPHAFLSADDQRPLPDRYGRWRRNTDVIHSDTTNPLDWEKFSIIDLGNKVYAIQTIDGHYVTAWALEAQPRTPSIPTQRGSARGAVPSDMR